MTARQFAVALAFVASIVTLTAAIRSPAQQPDWHCCSYTCYNPQAPARARQAYFCHPGPICPAFPSNDRSSSEICLLNGPGVQADSCQECVSDNH